MPGKIRQKTPLEKAEEAAKKKLADAKAALEKAKNPANEKAVTDAQTALNAAVKAASRERFVNFGQSRVATVISKIGAVEKLSRRQSYDYSADDVAEMFDAMGGELLNARNTFENALKGGTKTVTTKSFSFSKK